MDFKKLFGSITTAKEEKIEITKTINDGIKDRVTNPFIFTLIITWIVHNWVPIYSFFYFDKNMSLTARLQYFDKYWNDKFLRNLGFCIGISFIVLIFTYALKLVANGLSILYNNLRIKMSSLRTVTREEYNDLQNDLDIQAKKIETLETQRVGNVSSTEKSESEKIDFQYKIQENVSQLEDMKRKIEQLRGEKQALGNRDALNSILLSKSNDLYTDYKKLKVKLTELQGLS